jgi:hypothetical protein
MAEPRLTFQQRRQILQCSWKTENVDEVQRCWRNAFGTTPQARATTARLRDKFEADETVQNVNKGRPGEPRSSTDHESVDTVLQAFTQSQGKSGRQCSRESGGP